MTLEEHMIAMKKAGYTKRDLIQAWRALEITEEHGRDFENAFKFVKACDSGNIPVKKVAGC